MDDELLVVLGAGGLVLLALLLVLVRMRGGRRSEAKGGQSKPEAEVKTAGANRLIREGRFEEAARLAMRRQNWQEAMELYRRAGQHGNAAHAARRGELTRQAAELYEMAGDKDLAAECWQEAGDTERAEELRSGLPLAFAAPGAVEPALGAAGPGAQTPSAEASESESRFRNALAEQADGAAVQQLARDAAEELLALGEMRRAAEVYRDAGLEDEAIHLYVNVLGSPGEAAPLLAARGNHQRAAELYELAGQAERAASQWVEVARQADRPDSYLDRIGGLSADVAFQFLDMETEIRRAATENAELHYRFALACAERGDALRARQVLEVLLGAVGKYKDATERLRKLGSHSVAPAVAVAVPVIRPAAVARPAAAVLPPGAGLAVASTAASRSPGHEAGDALAPLDMDLGFEADQFVPLPDLPDGPEPVAGDGAQSAGADHAASAAATIVEGARRLAEQFGRVEEEPEPAQAAPPEPPEPHGVGAAGGESALAGGRRGGGLPWRGEQGSAGYSIVSSRDEVAEQAARAAPAQGDELQVGLGAAAQAPTALDRDPVDLSADEIVSLVMQASRASARRLKPVTVLEQIASVSSDAVPPSRKARLQRMWGGSMPQVEVAGIEQRPVAVSLLDDESVQCARGGPSLETLGEFIQGRGCDLGNIEVYYRLGLAQLAAGMWAEALTAFEAVEEASPGYRDADKRAQQIRSWTTALGERRTALGSTMVDGGQREQGRYELLGELGRGAMAVVYRAFDRVLGRQVALKFMAEEVSERPELRSMFEREAKAAAALNHPGIVTIYDFGMIEGRAFICMELVDGLPIDELIRELPIVESLRIITQALDALEYAHSRNTVHRTIKPANIMRTELGLVKLMDFGLAKPLDAKGKTSTIAGTPAFMSPEQLSGRGIDHRTDIFAMGVTLYELLSHELPFDGVERAAPPPRLSEHLADIPGAVDDAVLRALEFDPDKRWPSAAAFAQPLKQVIQAVSQYTSLPPPPASG